MRADVFGSSADMEAHGTRFLGSPGILSWLSSRLRGHRSVKLPPTVVVKLLLPWGAAAGLFVLPTKREASRQAWRVGLEVPQPWSRVGGEDPEPGSLVDEIAANVGGPGVDGCAHRPISERSYRLVGRGP